MTLPPSVKVLAPSLKLSETSNTVTLTVDDFKRLIMFALESTVVDEDWYIARYSDVREAAKARGSKSYATEHYRTHGFLEGRLPHEPVVDEAWYRKAYPDVDEAIRLGRQVDAKSHFVQEGYHEGRQPVPDVPRTTASEPAASRSMPPGAARPPARVPPGRLVVRHQAIKLV
jgi:hypothetical protein